VSQAISDEAVTRTLSIYAGLAARLLDDPADWLGDGDDEAARGTTTESGGAVVKGLGRVRGLGRAIGRRVTGSVHPGLPGWADLPVRQRDEWWVDRISAAVAVWKAPPHTARAPPHAEGLRHQWRDDVVPDCSERSAMRSSLRVRAAEIVSPGSLGRTPE